jgi:hypothetical protein
MARTVLLVIDSQTGMGGSRNEIRCEHRFFRLAQNSDERATHAAIDRLSEQTTSPRVARVHVPRGRHRRDLL